MKAGEWTSEFSYEQPGPRAEWLATPVSLSNRRVMRDTLGIVGPGWAGLADASPQLPGGAQLPDNLIAAVLDTAYLADARGMLPEGG